MFDVSADLSHSMTMHVRDVIVDERLRHNDTLKKSKKITEKA